MKKLVNRISRRFTTAHVVDMNGFRANYEFQGKVFDCLRVTK